MHFQIYLPGKRGQNPQHLAEVGLRDFVDGVNWFDEASGPDGGGGCIAAWPAIGRPAPGFRTEGWEWTPALPVDGLPAGRYWIGFADLEPPTPEELARPYQYQGRKFPLGDGRDWRFPEPQKLPHEMRFGDDGTWRFDVQRKFAAFVDACFDWTAFFEDNGADAPVEFARIAEFLESALRINYRLTREVVNRLGLFDTVNTSRPFLTSIGLLGRYEQLTGEAAE